jgi:hypothetical protein
MTLDIENCHSMVHTKQANMSKMEYSRSFGLAMKEAVKWVTLWAAYYHTSRKSWYPKPEETLKYSEVPTIRPLSIVEMSRANCDLFGIVSSRNLLIYFHESLRKIPRQLEKIVNLTMMKYPWRRINFQMSLMKAVKRRKDPTKPAI